MARAADDRVGHFVTSRVDYTEDTSPKKTEHYVNRWRLEKKDPGAAVSEPKEPVVYWLDKNIPEKYRKSVADGVLEWNKAFEKAGIEPAGAGPKEYAAELKSEDERVSKTVKAAGMTPQ